MLVFAAEVNMLKTLTVPTVALDVLSIGLPTVSTSEAPMFKFSDVASVLVMLGKIPIGEAMWDKIPLIGEWIMDAPSSAGRRAIIFGGIRVVRQH